MGAENLARFGASMAVVAVLGVALVAKGPFALGVWATGDTKAGTTGSANRGA